jgi:hypothetical protein
LLLGVLVLLLLGAFAAVLTVTRWTIVDTGWNVVGTSYDMTSDFGTANFKAIESLPEAQREATGKVYEDLLRLQLNELYRLRANADPCSLPFLLDCRNLKVSEIKPHIDAAIEGRIAGSAERSANTAHLSLLVSIVVGGLTVLISVGALLVSYLGYYRQRQSVTGEVK